MASVRKRRWTYKGESKEKWVVNYTDHGGSRRQRTFRLKKEADAYRLRVENELEAGTHTPRRLSMTLQAAVEAMLEDASGNVSPDYHMQLELAARKYTLPGLGNILLVDLTPQVVQAYADQLLSRGVSINPITRLLHALRRTLKLAMRMRPAWVSHNVMKESPPELPAQCKKQISIPTRNEARQILDASAAVGWCGVARPLIYLAVLTGMRASELRGLEWGDVDFAKGLIRVRRSRDSNGGLRPVKMAVPIYCTESAPLQRILVCACGRRGTKSTKGVSRRFGSERLSVPVNRRCSGGSKTRSAKGRRALNC